MKGEVGVLGALLTAGTLSVVALITSSANLGAVDIPWPATWSLATMLVIVLHKRVIAPQPFGSHRKFLAFVYAAFTHFLPAVICWTSSAMWLRANSFPWLVGGPGTFVVLIGILLLAKLLVNQEFLAFVPKTGP